MASIRARKDNGMLFIDFRYQDHGGRQLVDEEPYLRALLPGPLTGQAP